MQERIDCLDDGSNIGFRTGSPDAHPAGLLGQLSGQVYGDHEDWDFRKELSDLPGYIKSI